jgi:hypothetical protein
MCSFKNLILNVVTRLYTSVHFTWDMGGFMQVNAMKLLFCFPSIVATSLEETLNLLNEFPPLLQLVQSTAVTCPPLTRRVASILVCFFFFYFHFLLV